MKRLHFFYEGRYEFHPAVDFHSYALRILPPDNDRQRIFASEYSVFGGDRLLRPDEAEDAFGSRVISGWCGEPHESFRFSVSGVAYVDRAGKASRKLPPGFPMYRLATGLTAPGERIREFYEENRETVRKEGSARGRALLWMHLLFAKLTYRPESTTIDTTAEQAFTQACGVCQDYAHILISVLRLDGIPARYVAGFLIGEGATHAWCEAWCEEGWLGFDPTHDRELTDDYIEVATGRDYLDCTMDRGRFRGFTEQSQEILARVEEWTYDKGCGDGRFVRR